MLEPILLNPFLQLTSVHNKNSTNCIKATNIKKYPIVLFVLKLDSLPNSIKIKPQDIPNINDNNDKFCV